MMGKGALLSSSLEIGLRVRVRTNASERMRQLAAR